MTELERARDKEIANRKAALLGCSVKDLIIQVKEDGDAEHWQIDCLSIILEDDAGVRHEVRAAGGVLRVAREA